MYSQNVRLTHTAALFISTIAVFKKNDICNSKPANKAGFVKNSKKKREKLENSMKIGPLSM